MTETKKLYDLVSECLNVAVEISETLKSQPNSRWQDVRDSIQAINNLERTIKKIEDHNW